MISQSEMTCIECGELVIADEGYARLGVLGETCCLECYATVSTFLFEAGWFE